MIPGWVHEPRKHCGSGSLSDVMNYLGHNLSEPMCLGIGCGVGFFYVKGDFLNPTRLFYLRTMTLEPDFFKHLGIPFSWKKEQNNQKAFEDVKSCVRNGIPVLLQTDLYYMKYYNSSTHFPGHVVALWGYDDEKKESYVSDTHFEGLQTLTYEELEKARTSQAPPFPLENNWCEINHREPLTNMAKVIRASMRACANEMLRKNPDVPEFVKTGVPGIQALSGELPGWAEIKDVSWACRFAYQMIEKRGTGGGGFRQLYADFLKESEPLVQEIQKFGLSDMMQKSSSLWTEIALLLKNASESNGPKPVLEKTAEKVAEAASVEKTFFETVQNVVAG